MKFKVVCSILFFLGCSSVHAHVSQQGFVLLLPTDAYIASASLVVLLSALALMLLPSATTIQWSRSLRLYRIHLHPFAIRVPSLLASLVLVLLIYIGQQGPHDPLENLLPLTIWTILWTGIVPLHGLVGNLWYWINPWSGLFYLMRPLHNKIHNSLQAEKYLVLVSRYYACAPWIAIAALLMFSLFLLADPAPNDPLRLSWVVLFYWLFFLISGIALGGERWLLRAEFFTVLLHKYASLAPFKLSATHMQAGLPGWRILALKNSPKHGSANVVFLLVLLASGSFDGINETFWWLKKIDINPLAFPGRSAVLIPTVLGLFASIVLLIFVFAAFVLMGRWLSQRFYPQQPVVTSLEAIQGFSLSVLPIAWVYHIAHYLPSLLVDSQYALAALSDPFDAGEDYLSLGTYYVSTGFFSNYDSASIIWFTQAAVVVAGHLLAVFIAHSVAIRLYSNRRSAMLGLLPMTVFMTAYTGLGLWLLAAPRGA